MFIVKSTLAVLTILLLVVNIVPAASVSNAPIAKSYAAEAYPCSSYSGKYECNTLALTPSCSGNSPVMTWNWSNNYGDTSFNIVYSRNNNWYQFHVGNVTSFAMKTPPFGNDGSAGQDNAPLSPGEYIGGKITGGVPKSEGGSGITTGYTADFGATVPNCANTPTPTPSPSPTPSPTPSGPTATPAPFPVKLSIAAHVMGIDRYNLQLNGDGSPGSGLTGIQPRTVVLTFYKDITNKIIAKSMKVTFPFNASLDVYQNTQVTVALYPGTYYTAIRFPNLTIESLLDDNDPFTVNADGSITTDPNTGSGQTENASNPSPIKVPADPSKTPLLSVGDINGDNAIDTADYNLWLNTYMLHCTNTPASLDPNCQAAMSIPDKNIFYYDSTFGLYSDLNDDGSIDGIDYNLLRRSMGQYGLSYTH